MLLFLYFHIYIYIYIDFISTSIFVLYVFLFWMNFGRHETSRDSARIADNSTKSHKFLGLMNTSLKMNTHAYIGNV